LFCNLYIFIGNCVDFQEITDKLAENNARMRNMQEELMKQALNPERKAKRKKKYLPEELAEQVAEQVRRRRST
jgi:predicted anti-sigma-YlaC factor YlaD